MPRFPRLRDRRAGDGVVAIVLVVLFLGPALLLALGDKPSRFGFQMYSGYGTVEATWRDTRGRDHPVDPSDTVASLRGDIDWTASLPEALCRRLPDAVSVEVRQRRPGEPSSRRTPC